LEININSVYVALMSFKRKKYKLDVISQKLHKTSFEYDLWIYYFVMNAIHLHIVYGISNFNLNFLAYNFHKNIQYKIYLSTFHLYMLSYKHLNSELKTLIIQLRHHSSDNKSLNIARTNKYQVICNILV